MARLLFSFVVTILLVSEGVCQNRDDSNTSIERVVAVQNALYLGRLHLRNNEPKQSVSILESELANCNGSREYLSALRDAYYAYLMDLQRSKQNDQIPIILARLRKLDSSAKLPGYTDGVPNLERAAIPDPPRKVRAQADDSDPFQQVPLGTNSASAADLLRNADRAFSQEQFEEAAHLFEQAAAKDSGIMVNVKSKWAYCILKTVGDRLSTNPPSAELRSLETKTQKAIDMAVDKPELQKFGEGVLERIRTSLPANSSTAEVDQSGFSVFESTNFRIFHRKTNDVASRIASVAEKARVAAFEKWFGPAPAAWSPRCDIFIHANADEFVRNGKGQHLSHGFTTIEIQGGHPIRRRIDLVGDNPDLQTAALPREMTHVVLADIFPDPLLPRWADEAMAVLAEPRSNVDLYLRAASRCRREGKTFGVGPLLQSTEFPDQSAITPFYAESVSLVDLLVTMKGPKEFSVFLNAARRYGYEGALKRNYNIGSFSELQERWARHLGFPSAE